jgi:hypothetical protein
VLKDSIVQELINTKKVTVDFIVFAEKMKGIGTASLVRCQSQKL